MHAAVIAGTHSGVGKTTVTLGLLAALQRRGLKIQAFKVGPDFIDPGHHTTITGRASRTLDGWMLSRIVNEQTFWHHMQGQDVGLIEGMMGLFDGVSGTTDAGSTAEMAKWLGLPVILVVDAAAMARSAAALVHGFRSFDPQLRVSGVIFNRRRSTSSDRDVENPLRTEAGAFRFLLYVIAVAAVVIVVALLV